MCFFYVQATTGIYPYGPTLSLHDSLPCCPGGAVVELGHERPVGVDGHADVGLLGEQRRAEGAAPCHLVAQEAQEPHAPLTLLRGHVGAGVGERRQRGQLTRTEVDDVDVDRRRRSEERRVGKEWSSTCR